MDVPARRTVKPWPRRPPADGGNTAGWPPGSIAWPPTSPPATSSAGQHGGDPPPPAPVLLVHAGRGFAVGGVVSDLLDRYALPRRDNFAVCVEYCARTQAMLRKVLGPHIMRRYSAGPAMPT
ncbi:hypothetical protein [Acrocarpospora catenulata]|uniref:hypothetical protein n=1 Tax=Acrocarpospora catenulata TaxID=2836182 RepID=UPI001BDAB783|nr:hypothetical protein [Acrocarpospora catenulata]